MANPEPDQLEFDMPVQGEKSSQEYFLLRKNKQHVRAAPVGVVIRRNFDTDHLMRHLDRIAAKHHDGMLIELTEDPYEL